jgi:asparagine synthase (glutamine-hydrolysing)
VTVALGGDGGDELYAGYRTHKALRLAQLWRRLPATIRETVAARAHRAAAREPPQGQLRPEGPAVRPLGEPVPAGRPLRLQEFLDEDARRALTRLDAAAVEPTVRLWRAACAAHPFGDPLDAILYSDLQLYLPDDILVKIDRITMAHSLEARSPFLDHRLVEHAADCPRATSCSAAHQTPPASAPCGASCPFEVLEREKGRLQRADGRVASGRACGACLRDTLSRTRVQDMGLWSPRRRGRIDRRHTSDENATTSRTLWALLCFAAWNDRHRGGRAP